jgi:hypothetical protein
MITSNLALPLYGPNHPEAGHDQGRNHDGAMAILDSTVVLVGVPASATAVGKQGQVAADASFLYIATGTNQWKRVAIAAW